MIFYPIFKKTFWIVANAAIIGLSTSAGSMPLGTAKRESKRYSTATGAPKTD
jgi:hypothetical protein